MKYKNILVGCKCCLAAGQKYNTRGAWLRSLLLLEILVSEHDDIFFIQTQRLWEKSIDNNSIMVIINKDAVL